MKVILMQVIALSPSRSTTTATSSPFRTLTNRTTALVVLITEKEFIEMIQKLPNNKVAGLDVMSAETFKYPKGNKRYVFL